MVKKAGLFGFLMHVAIVTVFLMWRNLSGERLDTGLMLVGVPLLLLSSFLVYNFIVSRYVARRQGSVVIDSLVGMLAECIIFTFAAVFLGFYDGLRTGAFQAVLTGMLMNILWVYATFLVQILVLGNLCGLVGWFLLREKQQGR